MLRHALVMRATMAATFGGRTAQVARAHSAAVRSSLSAFPVRAFSTDTAAGPISAPVTTATVVPATAAAAAASPAAASSPSGSTAPSRRRQRAWADPSTIVMLKERGIVRTRGVRPRPEGSNPHSPIKASLQRGAPKPRPLLPVPAALRGVEKPWMQQQLDLHFEAESATQTAHNFTLKMTQWTGMEEIGWRPPQRRRPARAPVAQSDEADEVDEVDADSTAAPAAATDDVVAEAAAEPDTSSTPVADVDAAVDEDAWVDAPVLTPEQEAAEAEARAQADAGSGTIVWDAALHLAHWLHAAPSMRVRGPILELGAGTGALGLAVQKILAQQADGDSRAVLTDGGKVLELLQKNVQANGSNAVVLPLDWSDVPSFLSQLPTSSSPSSSPLPPFFRTLLCSELLDSIPSPANAHRAFDRKSFATLVDALTQLARHSLAAQASVDSSAGAASVDILFTFEQRGVLSLGPDGILQEQLLEPLRQAGFAVERIEEPSGVYTKESNMTLFRMRME